MDPEEREGGSDYTHPSMLESKPDNVQQAMHDMDNIVEMAARERSRSPLEPLAQVEKRELVASGEQYDHLHKVEEQHERETEILKELSLIHI